MLSLNNALDFFSMVVILITTIVPRARQEDGRLQPRKTQSSRQSYFFDRGKASGPTWLRDATSSAWTLDKAHALAYHLVGDVGAEVSAAEAATRLDKTSPAAWSAFAHALARTDRVQECIDACRTALKLGPDPEVSDLLQRVEASGPRELPAARSAA